MVLWREWGLSPNAFHGDQNTTLPAGVTAHESGTEGAGLNPLKMAMLSPCTPLEPAPSPTQSPLKKTKFRDEAVAEVSLVVR